MSGKHMSYAAGSGAMGLLKDGYKHFSGVQEAVLKNTEAVKILVKFYVQAWDRTA